MSLKVNFLFQSFLAITVFYSKAIFYSNRPLAATKLLMRSVQLFTSCYLIFIVCYDCLSQWVYYSTLFLNLTPVVSSYSLSQTFKVSRILWFNNDSVEHDPNSKVEYHMARFKINFSLLTPPCIGQIPATNSHFLISK